MFEFLKTIVSVNQKTLHIEAKLWPMADCLFDGKGEVELEAYADDTANIEIEVKRTVIPDGTLVDVIVADCFTATLTVIGGRHRLLSWQICAGLATTHSLDLPNIGAAKCQMPNAKCLERSNEPLFFVSLVWYGCGVVEMN